MFLICKARSSFYQRLKISLSLSFLFLLPLFPSLLFPSPFPLPSCLPLSHSLTTKNEMASIKPNASCPCEGWGVAYLWKFCPHGPWASLRLTWLRTQLLSKSFTHLKQELVPQLLPSLENEINLWMVCVFYFAPRAGRGRGIGLVCILPFLRMESPLSRGRKKIISALGNFVHIFSSLELWLLSNYRLRLGVL